MKRYFAILSLMALVLVLAGVGRVWAQSEARRSVELELEPIENATAYEIELESVVSKKRSYFKMKTPVWRAKIRPGKYRLRLRSYDERGVAGEWSEDQEFIVAFPAPKLLRPAQNAEIKTGQEESAEIEFVWTPVPGATQYRLDVTSETGQTYSETISDTKAKLKLPVAQAFTWAVTTLMPTGEDGEPAQELWRFAAIAAKIRSPEIEKPYDKYVQTISWSKPERAEKFSYIVSRIENRVWKVVAKKSGVADNEFHLPYDEPGGKYRVQVRAEAHNREPSDIAKIEFDVHKGNRSPAAIEEARLRDSLEKPTTWYGIASYLITNLNYSSTNSQSGQNPNVSEHVAYPPLGGTGRLGLGYFKPNSTTGYIGILDLSGINVSGENVTFASAEMHYAKRYYWGVNQIRLSGGLFYKELPQSFSLGNNKYRHEIVSYYGPHAGADFWHPFSYKYGLQLNARMYVSTFTGRTPNGNDVTLQPSLQFGLMGTMRLSANAIGFAGWAYRQDKVSYKKSPTANPNTADNEISLTGNYINFMLEYGF